MEIINGTYGGSNFNSSNAAAIACLLVNLTACGFHSSAEALEIATEQGPAATIAEIADELELNAEQVSALEYAWSDAIEMLED